MHTTGQAFAMAFQAGGPHAQDRGLEAVATAWAEMSRAPASAVWEKPQGKAAPLVIEKHWRMVPRGVALVIGCQTFPTWNSYPGLFASLATGNTVIVKPHPGATLPLALTVAVLRDLLAEEGLPRDVVLLAADAPEAPITKDLVRHPAVAIVDYTGSNAFGAWVRANAGEGAGLHRGGWRQLDRHRRDRRLRRHVRQHRLLARALLRPDVHRAAGHLRPAGRHRHRRGAQILRPGRRRHRHGDRRLLADPARAAGVFGAIANPATLDRVAAARNSGESSATARRSPRDAAPRR